jgi:hypothetical protein
MSNKLEHFQEKMNILIAESEESDVKDFTYNLILLVWSEVCGVPDPEIDETTVESMIIEIEQSLEIMNPELKLDVKALEELLNCVKSYQESE